MKPLVAQIDRLSEVGIAKLRGSTGFVIKKITLLNVQPVYAICGK